MSSGLGTFHYPRRSLHSSRSVPTLPAAPTAMELPHSKRPSLPSISRLIDAVTKQAEKGSAQSLNYDSEQMLGPSTDRPYTTGAPGIVHPLTPDSGRPRLWRRSADVMEQNPPVWCPASPYSESSTEWSAYMRLTQQRLLFMKCPRPLPRIMARHPVGASMVPTWRHHSDRSTHVESRRRTQDGYLCPTCSKLFSRPSGLKIHMHSHTGEKRYRCRHEGCGKCFSVKSNMTRHNKRSHDREIGFWQPESIIPV